MSKEGNEYQQFNSAIASGQANKKNIPLIKNWCKNIVITDRSAGMIADFYNLPMQQQISCPHTTSSYEGLNVAWCASDFIVENCIDCNFREERSANNFGRPIIERRKMEMARYEKEKQEKDAIKSAMCNEIEKLLVNDISKSEITTLSILKLVQGLEDSEQHDVLPAKILEATKLSPKFFNQISLDFISIFFDEKFGNTLLMATHNISLYGTELSTFAFTNVLRCIENRETVDIACQIIDNLIEDSELVEAKEVFEVILDTCEYDESFGRRVEGGYHYPGAAILFKRLHQVEFRMFDELITNRLKINNKNARINTIGFLNDLIRLDVNLVLKYTPLVIATFEFKDDTYGNSADSCTRKLLSKIYKHDKQFLIDEIEKLYPKSSNWAKIEIIEFFEMILTSGKNKTVTKYSTLLIEKLVVILLTNNSDEKFKEQILDTNKRVSKERPGEYIEYFDALLGLLVKAHQERSKLKWQIEDLKNTEKPTLTFNPLIGKNVYEIDSMQIRADNVIRDAQKIMENVIIFEPDKLYPQVVTIIFELDSKKDELLKNSLIDVLRTSVKDIVSVGNLLPSIYSFIHDIDSEMIRGAGMKYVVHILENHYQLVTQTFINTIKIFLKDPVILIKGMAIEAFGVLMRRFPEQVDEESIKLLLSYILDKYVFIHKNAAKLSYNLYPFLDDKKLGTLIINLLKLEHIYSTEKDLDFDEDVINILLFVTRNNPKAYSTVVKKNLVGLCNCKDHHYENKAIERLTEITLEDKQFENIWCVTVIRFLTYTFPDRHSSYMDSRKKLFDAFYKIQPKVFINNISLFNAFIRNRIDKGVFLDIRECYSLLAFYNLYSDLEIAVDYFEKSIPHTTSEQYAHDFNKIANNITKLEQLIGNDKVTLKAITILKDEL